MKAFRKHIAWFLLLTLFFVNTPHIYIHNLFNDHTDDVANYCEAHGHQGIHFENKQVHCELLKIDSPVYTPVYFSNEIACSYFYIQTLSEKEHSFFFLPQYPHTPSRGPPVA